MMSGSNEKDNAMEMQRNRHEYEAQETQCSSEEDGTMQKRRNGPMNEAAVMQRGELRARQWCYREAEMKTRPKRRRANKMRTRPW